MIEQGTDLTYQLDLLPGQQFTGKVYFWSNGDPMTANWSVQSNFYLTVTPNTVTSSGCSDVKWVDFNFAAPIIAGYYSATVTDQNNNWSPVYVDLLVTNSPTIGSTYSTMDIVAGCFNFARDTVRWNGFSIQLGCGGNFPQIGGINQSLYVNYYLYEGQVGWLIFSPPTFTVSPYGSVEVLKTFAGNYNLPNSVWEIRTRNWYSFPRFIKWTKNIIAPPNIVLNYPPNGGTGIPFNNLTFDWSDYPFVHNYGLEISTNSNFNSVLIRVDSIWNSQYTLTNGVLQNNTQYFWRLIVRRQGCGEIISAPFSFSTGNLSITLGLTLFIQGFLNPNNNTQVPDSVNIYLRTASSPYSIVDFSKGVVSSNGTITTNFLNTLTGNYYIVVKHRNSIETWSKSGGVNLTSGTTTAYNFSSSISQAYGNNLILKGSKYCIYSGDSNRDGSVDVSDLSMIDNDANNFVSGYVSTDINGDNFVELSDLVIADNNSLNFVTIVRP